MASVLAASWQAASVADATVATNVGQSADVSVDFALQVAFDLVVGVKDFTQFGYLRYRSSPAP